jgi:hypothetical protein
MEAIHIRQRLRPIRYAFIIKEGDFSSALASVSLNTVIWGGIYNPIISVTPAERCAGILKDFDVDELVDLTAGELSPELRKRFEHRIVSADSLVRMDDRRKKRYLRLGFAILPILEQIYEKEVRFLPEPTRAAIISSRAADGWSEHLGFSYGAFSWLPETDIDFKANFRKALKARDTTFDPGDPTSKLGDPLSPVQFTAYGLRSLRDTASVSSHVIYIGDHRNLADLLDFWNMRATGRTIVFVPVAYHTAYEELVRRVARSGHYPINPRVENMADLQKGPTLKEEAFTKVCDWISGLDIGRLARRLWQPRFDNEDEMYVGDIHASEVEAQSGEEVSLLEGDTMTPVKLIFPEHLESDRVRRGEYAWSIELTMSGGAFKNDVVFAFPSEPALEAVVRQSVLGHSGEVRIGRHGVVIRQDHPRDSLYLSPVPTVDVFYALFREAGLEAEPSQPGRYAEQIIKKMGGRVQFDCRVFKIRGVREILDKLSTGSVLTKGNMYQIVMSTEEDEYGRNWRAELYEDIVLTRGQRGAADFTHIFNVLLDQRVIRPGFTLRCRDCFAEGWYHVSEFSEEYTCRFCFSRQRVNFGAVHEWQYKADGLFRIPDSGLGSVAVILSLWRLEEFEHMNRGRYLVSTNLHEIGAQRNYEIDYAYLTVDAFKTSYDLVVGQATRFSDFTGEEVRKMADLARKFPKEPYLAFSTLKDAFSSQERALLADLVDQGHRVIALTREELDPYGLHKRFEGAPVKYASDLRDLSKNTCFLNLGISL